MNSYEMFESLEGRQFLSVTPVVAHVAHPVKHHVVHHHHAAKPHHATTKAAAATVNVVGQYTGTATINFLGSSHDVDVSLNIQSQSGGDLSGTIAINGADPVKFKVSDAFDANGNFTVSYNKDGASATLTGHKTSTGGLAGSLSASYAGLSADGTFALNSANG